MTHFQGSNPKNTCNDSVVLHYSSRGQLVQSLLLVDIKVSAQSSIEFALEQQETAQSLIPGQITMSPVLAATFSFIILFYSKL